MSFPYCILYTVLCVQGQIFEDWGVKEKKRKEETREALYGLVARDCLVPNLQVKVQKG